MFNVNEFKRKVKVWMQNNPNAQVSDLVDFCEELIPAAQYNSNHWLVEQTVSWFEHIKAQKDSLSHALALDREKMH